MQVKTMKTYKLYRSLSKAGCSELHLSMNTHEHAKSGSKKRSGGSFSWLSMPSGKALLVLHSILAFQQCSTTAFSGKCQHVVLGIGPVVLFFSCSLYLFISLYQGGSHLDFWDLQKGALVEQLDLGVPHRPSYGKSSNSLRSAFRRLFLVLGLVSPLQLHDQGRTFAEAKDLWKLNCYKTVWYGGVWVWQTVSFEWMPRPET